MVNNCNRNIYRYYDNFNHHDTLQQAALKLFLKISLPYHVTRSVIC